MVDSLGDRIKKYEAVTQAHLIRRMPVIIRLDGCHFSKFTKWCVKPFDEQLSNIMADTTEYLINNIQGAVFGYTQSDEITLVLKDYDTFETEAWFGNNIQKIVSVSASTCSAFFNKQISEYTKVDKLATFDSRVFNVSKEEVANVIIWRQKDIIRNSVQALGQYHLGHKVIQGLNNLEVMQKLYEAGVDILTIPKRFTHGIACTKDIGIDLELPTFTEDRNYIEKYII